MNQLSGSSILIRCDAWPEIGFGHVMRCFALADELKESHGCDITFAMSANTAGHSMAEANGYRVLTADQDVLSNDYAGWLKSSVDEVRARALILDIRDALPVFALKALKDMGIIIASIDDPSERRLQADLAFYPPVPQLQRLDWTGFSGRLFAGWPWVILRRQFAHPVERKTHSRPVVLVTMGGSDPAGLTLKAVSALNMLDEDLDVQVLLGPGFLHDKALDSLVLESCRNLHLLRGVKDISRLMSQADLALASFGVTAYELAAMGVPGLFMCLTDDHVESASAFVESGMGECAGRHDMVSAKMLSTCLAKLIRDRSRLEAMSSACMSHVDGNGARRVAEEIMGRVGNDR